MIQRRDLLAGAAATGVLSLLPFGHATAAVEGWNGGLVAHLLPTVSHDRILLKASFHEPLRETPLLYVGGRLVAGERTDSEGFFWQFDAAGLEPSRPYGLILTDARGRPLCDEWPLATRPPMTNRGSCACSSLLVRADMTDSVSIVPYLRAFVS